MQQLAQLASEHWKLLRNFRKAISLLEDAPAERFKATLRYAERFFDKLLEDTEMRVVTFDGMTFEENLPAQAVNGSDFDNGEALLVDTTLEPAVIHDMRVIIVGKVYLRIAREGKP